MHRVAVAAQAGADDDGLRRSLRHIWSDHLRQQDGDHMHADTRAPATKIVLNATGQEYRQTTSFAYLGCTVTATPNPSDEIDRRIRAGWMGFKRYTRELYDSQKTSLQPLKAWMVSSEVVEALLHGCTTWPPLKGHYTKLRTTPQDVASNPRSLVQVAEKAHPLLLQRRPPANRMREHRNNRAHEKVVVGGSAAPHG